MHYLVFDFDGTIADTFQSVQKLAKQLKKEYSSEDFNFDEARNTELRDIFKKLKIPFYKIPLIANRIKKGLQLEISENAKTFPQMNKVLANLSKNFRLGILSSNSKENIEKFLQRNNLAAYFDFIYSDSSIFGKHKVMQAMLKDYHINANQMIYVGDEKRDVIACKKLKIPIIAVTWGYNSEELLIQEKPEYLAHKPSDIEKILLLKKPNRKNL